MLLPETTSPVKIRMCENCNADTRICGTDEGQVINVFLVFPAFLVVTANEFKLSVAITRWNASRFFSGNATEIKDLSLS